MERLVGVVIEVKGGLGVIVWMDCGDKFIELVGGSLRVGIKGNGACDWVRCCDWVTDMIGWFVGSGCVDVG